jgi:hypothetical protein
MKRFTNKTLLLSTVILLILLILPVTALANGGEGENKFTQTINGYQVTLVFEKPAMVGENQVHIQLSDAQNMPIPNASLGVSVIEGRPEHTEMNTSAADSMAGMPGMEGMEGMPEQPASSDTHNDMVMVVFEPGHESGEYAGNLPLQKAGEWIIRVHLTAQNDTVEFDFPISVVSQSGPGRTILAGFLAVNGAIIATAVFMKRKPVSVPLSKKA